jgi:adenosylcobyric acid synthase
LKKCRNLMVQGTSSHSGKTLLVAALCRLLARRGYRVSPFKAQNMSLNSFVTNGGAEISRAQALQALAAGIEPTADINPILLKPKDSRTCQVIVHGKPLLDINYKDYVTQFAPNKGLEAIRESYRRLSSRFDMVVIEGAGSPVEINLPNDIANMTIAKMADAPVILVADIDRGGVFATLLGTIGLLSKRERALVKGLVINKLRGDSEILEPGIRLLQKRTAKKVLGIIPYIPDLALPQEDSLFFESYRPRRGARYDIVVIRLPHIANFTDFDPLYVIAEVKLRYVSSVEELGAPDALIIPGTKNTLSDLKWLMKNGLASEILKVSKLAVPVIGICGGYQMLGRRIVDRMGVEGSFPDTVDGLRLLDVSTEFEQYAKTIRKVSATAIGRGPLLDEVGSSGVTGYEIHMGNTVLGPSASPAFKIRVVGTGQELIDGATDSSGLVLGTYLHGLFDGSFREALLKYIANKKGFPPTVTPSRNIQDDWASSVDIIADVVSKSLNIAEVYRIIGLTSNPKNSIE